MNELELFRIRPCDLLTTFIFCSCLDFFSSDLYLWKMLDFQLYFYVSNMTIFHRGGGTDEKWNGPIWYYTPKIIHDENQQDVF